MERFDAVTTDPQPAVAPAPSLPSNGASTNGTSSHALPSSTPGHINGQKRSSPDSSASLPSRATGSTPPVFKKHKASRSIEDSDAAFAARLQAEEDGRARSTRGGGAASRRKNGAGGSGAGTPKKREKKRKSRTRVGSGDDSGAEGGEGVVRNTGFHVSMRKGRVRCLDARCG